MSAERGRGRPPIGPVVKVRLPDEQRAALEAFAESEGLKLAAALRLLVERGLATAAVPRPGDVSG